MRLTFWVGFWIFLVDQATKWFVVHWLDLMNRLTIEVLPPFITFRMAWNRGVNFGLLSGYDLRWVLVGLALVISAAVIWWASRDRGSRAAHLSAGLLVGGALGNVVDRILYEQGVMDFLNVTCCGFENPYSFNVADIAVFAGAIGLVLFTGEDDKGSPRRKKA